MPRSLQERVRDSEAKAEERGVLFLKTSIRIDPPFTSTWTRLREKHGVKGAMQELLRHYKEKGPKS